MMQTLDFLETKIALLAPRDVRCLLHFGAGHVSEWLIRAILSVRPSIRRVFLVRENLDKDPPPWFNTLGPGIEAELVRDLPRSPLRLRRRWSLDGCRARQLG